MKRLYRMYVRHKGVQYPLYQSIPNHPKTEEVVDAIALGSAQVLAEYYQYGMLGTDVNCAVVRFEGKTFALIMEVKYSNE